MAAPVYEKTNNSLSLCDQLCSKGSSKDKTIHLVFSCSVEAIRCAALKNKICAKVLLDGKEVVFSYEGLTHEIHLRIAYYLHQHRLFPVHAAQEIAEILEDKKAKSILLHSNENSMLWENERLVEASMRAAIREGDESWQKKLFFLRFDLNFFSCLALAIEQAKSPDSFIVRKILSRVSEEDFLCWPEDFDRNIHYYKLAHLAIDHDEKSVLSRMAKAYQKEPAYANPLLAVYKARQKSLAIFNTINSTEAR